MAYETRIALIDLDRTVADCSERFKRAGKPDGKINWKIALDPDLVELDKLIEGADKAIQHIYNADYQVIFLTGRAEKMRYATMKWLAQHEIFDAYYRLIMRPDGDFTKAHEFKLREIDRLVQEEQPDKLIFVDDLVEEFPEILAHVASAKCYASLNEACNFVLPEGQTNG